MIIKDIRLTNFGKFNHKMVTLEPGLNIVYGEKDYSSYFYKRNALWNRKTAWKGKW